MKVRSLFSLALVTTMASALLVATPGSAGERPALGRDGLRAEDAKRGFVPAVARLDRSAVGRYFVVMKAPSLADRVRAAGDAGVEAADQRAAATEALAGQAGAIREARGLGGTVSFRYGRVVNAFSAKLTREAAERLASRADVASVQPVSIVKRHNSTSVPFIGTTPVWDAGFTGTGMRVALVDTGIDYTHAAFGGSGDPADYEANDPAVIEPGTFPTPKVIGGFDFVGQDYDLFDDDPNNDDPRPDPDPLDSDGHGTHTGGTCCGFEVPGKVGAGVAKDAVLYGYKVWDEGNSSDDVLVAAYEAAVDPNGDGNTNDRADVLSFSGGVTYGTKNSVEAQAAQSVVDLGTVFVASAGNSGNQNAGGSAYVTGTPSTASGVISVAASIDQFVAQTLSVNNPSGVVLPDNGIIVKQGWGGALTTDLTDDVFDARAVDPPADPSGQPAPSDRPLCDEVPPGSPFAGQIVLVFKGSTGAGDCDGSLKALNAEQAGAIAVIFWNGFGGLPFGLGAGCCGAQVTIPVVMASELDSEALGAADSPDASSGVFNTGGLNVTLHADPAPIPGFEDSMTSFTSEGPARWSNELKPDISAPGFNITSAGVGQGDGAAVSSGTSMAAPHVSGAATLIRQIHPNWTPAMVKAALMNQATLDMANNDLTAPAPATVIGAGRVQVDESAKARTLAAPGSLSYGFAPTAVPTPMVKSFFVRNLDTVPHQYSLTPSVRYSDFAPGASSVQVMPAAFNLPPGGTQQVRVRVSIDPSAISEAEQQFGWYYFHPNVDGIVEIQQTGGTADTLHVSWHVAPLAASRNAVSESWLDLTGGSDSMAVGNLPSAGISYADLYLLGAADDTSAFLTKDLAEADVLATGARSFTGSTIDGVAEGVPTGTDALAGITWQQFLTFTDEPTEPVEIGVQFAGVHNITETLEVDVLIDAGADGVFADPGLQADYMVVKQTSRGGAVCVFDLSQADPFDHCTHTYFPDYTNYNGNILGIVVDASAIGLSDAAPEFSYKVVACAGVFSGDVPDQACDEAGGFDGTTHTARLHTTNPALVIDPLVCGGFWDGPSCGPADPVDVTVGSAQPGDNPSILVLFPNNAPAPKATIVRTTT